MGSLEKKLQLLRAVLREHKSMAVAFSGGVDSSLLLFIAHQELGDQCVAVTARSHSFPERELQESQRFCTKYDIPQVFIDNNEFEIEGFLANPPDRCYLCKHALLSKILVVASSRGLCCVAEGSTLDDDKEYRPGMKAVKELGVTSPLRDAGLTKDDIRQLSRQVGLASADKQSFACLSTRFACGEEITLESLRRVDKAEQFLIDHGLRQLRVRSHGNLARIETDQEGMATFSAPEFRKQAHEALIRFGFTFVSLDLIGYKMGSMNFTQPELT